MLLNIFNAMRAPQPGRRQRQMKCIPTCSHRGNRAAGTCGAAGICTWHESFVQCQDDLTYVVVLAVGLHDQNCSAHM
jgi:hypothetical protein